MCQMDQIKLLFQTRRESGVEGISYPGPCDVWGVPPSARNLQSTSECTILNRKIKKIFSSKGPRENVCELLKNVFPGPAVALDGPVLFCKKI